MESILNPNLELEVRNWLELPEDIISMILLKLGAIEILDNAQNVCSLWRKICKDPLMWRAIDMRNSGEYDMDYDLEIMCNHAIDRSCGGLVDINLELFGTDGLLEYITKSSNRLQRLRLVSCPGISNDGLIKAVSELPLLEHLELYHCSFTTKTLEAVGQSCPLLKSFKLNYDGHRKARFFCDKEAFAIAENMPNLRHLQIFGNELTDKGLQAILDGCPYLESLDLRMCINLLWEGQLGSKCADRIKNLRLPDDPVDDYEFGAIINDDDDYFQNIDDDEDYDEDYPSRFSNIDDDFFTDVDDDYVFSGGSDFSDYGEFDFDFY